MSLTRPDGEVLNGLALTSEVHGDVAPGNLLAMDGRLSAVIDFGCAAVGDPACDLTIAWTLFAGARRAALRAALPLDAATWALWKARITVRGHRGRDPARAVAARGVLAQVLAEHGGAAPVARRRPPGQAETSA